jgi:DNA-binding MarR family transcriptional regulator
MPTRTPPPPAPVSDGIELDADLAPTLRMAVLRLARVLRQQDVHTGATMSQLSALSMLALHGAMTLGELAARERVRPPSMTRIAAALEEQGFVSREPDANDRRVARLRVTRDGERVLAESRARRTAFLQLQLQGLSAEEREAVEAAVPLLERLAGRPA